MALWTERFVALAVFLAAGAQVGDPGELFVSGEVRHAVLLEDGNFFSMPSSDGAIAAHFPAGTVLDYTGEATDDFERTWFMVRHPEKSERQSNVYLTNLDQHRLADLGYRAAVLANREPGVAAPIPPPTIAGGPKLPLPAPWWRPVAMLELDHSSTFNEVLAITARAPEERTLHEAIELLGGREAIAMWPDDPLPGELFVPPMIPALFQFDGVEWRLARPVRLLGDAISLLGNPTFETDPKQTTLAGGPALHCWSLIGSLDPAGRLAGSVRVAPRVADPSPPAVLLEVGRGAAPVTTRVTLPTTATLFPYKMLIPPRVDSYRPSKGIVLQDVHSQQAAYVEQTLSRASTRALRGKSLVLDLITRNAPGASAAATFGIDIEIRFSDDTPPEHFSASFPSSDNAGHVAFPFDVAMAADTITVRLLVADRSVAREQRGSVIFDRASLRLASWPSEPPASSVVLYRITANTFEGAPLYTRAPMVVTPREVEQIEQVWADIVETEWSKEDKQRILAGEIRHGMTEQQVRLSWGEPSKQAQLSVEGNDKRWDYPDRYAVFADGNIIAFSRASPQSRDQTAAPLMCPGLVNVLPANAGQ
ncbi:MAG: hypothetical protein QF680_01635 [Acidobacteriota bacterium]|jgi:hypothetical protein|nr:hypothetical protein [Acidobacteriota bacterium]